MGNNKKGFELGQIGTAMTLIGFICMILTLVVSILIVSVSAESFSVLYVAYVFLGIGVALAIIGCVLLMIEKSNDKEAKRLNIQTFQHEYERYADDLDVVRSDIQVTLVEPEHCFKIPHYLWIKNNRINFFPMAQYYIQNCISPVDKPDVSQLHIKSILIDAILYFEEMGELRKYTTVSGGGTSLKGALLGYAVADDLGAIIASREPIKTSVVSEDSRKVELLYKDQDGDIKNLEFTHGAYKVFKELIPEKELRRIVNLEATKKESLLDEKRKDPHDTRDKLRQLQEMRKEDLITEEEFIEQKKKLLDSL